MVGAVKIVIDMRRRKGAGLPFKFVDVAFQNGTAFVDFHRYDLYPWITLIHKVRVKLCQNVEIIISDQNVMHIGCVGSVGDFEGLIPVLNVKIVVVKVVVINKRIDTRAGAFFPFVDVLGKSEERAGNVFSNNGVLKVYFIVAWWLRCCSFLRRLWRCFDCGYLRCRIVYFISTGLCRITRRERCGQKGRGE